MPLLRRGGVNLVSFVSPISSCSPAACARMMLVASPTLPLDSPFPLALTAWQVTVNCGVLGRHPNFLLTVEVNRDACLKPYRCQMHASLRLGFFTLSVRCPHMGKAISLFWASSEASCRCFHLRRRHEDFADFSDAFRAFLLIDSQNPFLRIFHPTHRYTSSPFPVTPFVPRSSGKTSLRRSPLISSCLG